tara:strand:+ start:3072 stop:5024 length:1953 start_codon:yes stop_codon:yes gene_type:complete
LNIYITASQLEESPYPLWHDFLKKLLLLKNTFILTEASLNNHEIEDLSISLKKTYGLAEDLNFAWEIEDNNKNNVLLDFHASLASMEKFSDFKKVGFIGFKDNFEEKINYYSSFEFDLLISEFLPDEIPHTLNEKEISFFISTFYFLPPHPSSFKITKSIEDQILIIIDSHSVTYKDKDLKYLRILDRFETFKILDVGKTTFCQPTLSASSIFFANISPQYKHCFRISSPIKTEDLNQRIDLESPLRNIFFKTNYLEKDLIFKQNELSLRGKLNGILNQKKEEGSKEFASNLDPNEEFSRFLGSIEGKNNCAALFNFPRTFGKERIKIVQKSFFPNWIFKPTTEAFLFHLISTRIEEEKSGETSYSFPEEVFDFIMDSYFLLQILDRNNLFLSNFLKLFDLTSENVLERFHKITISAKSNFVENIPAVADWYSEIAYKLIKQELRFTFSAQKPSINQKTASTLLRFIHLGDSNQKDSVNKKTRIVTILIISDQGDSALEFCRQEKESSDRNIICVTSALCFGIRGEIDNCKKALLLYEFKNAQYGKDYVSVAYFFASFLAGIYENEFILNTIKSYNSRKPSKEWWQTELTTLAILKTIPESLSPNLISVCKDYLSVNLNFNEKDFVILHSSNETEDKATLVLRKIIPLLI